jgi:hypothetical protein
MALEHVSEENNDIRPQRLDLTHPLREPLLSEVSAEVSIGHGDKYSAIQFGRQAGKGHLTGNHRR